MDISNLSQEQQKTFLDLLGQNNQQSMDPSAFGVPPRPTLEQQPGDKMHPMDAIQQISQKLQMDAPVSGAEAGPSAPAGVSLATGPALAQDKFGRLSARLPADHPLLDLLGIKKKVDVNEPNYYDAAKSNDLLKYMPSGAARMPDGTPFISKTMYDTGLDSRKTLVGQGKEVYTTLDQLTSQGFDPDTARKLLAANPQGVTSKEVSAQMGNRRLQDTHTIAEARATMAGVAKLGQMLKVGGFDALQPAAEVANKNLGLAERAQAAIDQIVAAGGVADQRQRSELSTAIAGLSGNGSSIITDDRMKQFLPDSAKGKFGNIYEYWSNERQPMDFTGFLPQLQDLLSREQTANKGISNAASLLGQQLMSNTGQPNAARAVANARQVNPLVGTVPPASPTIGIPKPPPPIVPHYNTVDDVKAAYQAGKLTMVQSKALVKAMNKGR